MISVKEEEGRKKEGTIKMIDVLENDKKDEKQCG